MKYRVKKKHRNRLIRNITKAILLVRKTLKRKGYNLEEYELQTSSNLFFPKCDTILLFLCHKTNPGKWIYIKNINSKIPVIEILDKLHKDKYYYPYYPYGLPPIHEKEN